MSESTPRRRGPSGAEWVIFAVAAVLVAAVFAVLLLDWTSDPSEPAAFDVTVERVFAVGDLHHVEAAVRNTGGESVADATVSATLETDGDPTELEEVISFLAPDEEASVTFIFEDDPDDGELTVEVSSFREP